MSATAAAWFSSFFYKPFVRCVNRRTNIRIVKFTTARLASVTTLTGQEPDEADRKNQNHQIARHELKDVHECSNAACGVPEPPTGLFSGPAFLQHRGSPLGVADDAPDSTLRANQPLSSSFMTDGPPLEKLRGQAGRHDGLRPVRHYRDAARTADHCYIHHERAAHMQSHTRTVGLIPEFATPLVDAPKDQLGSGNHVTVRQLPKAMPLLFHPPCPR